MLPDNKDRDITEDIILKSFVENHGFDISGMDETTLKALIRYSSSVGYNQGYTDKKTADNFRIQSIVNYKMAIQSKARSIINGNHDSIFETYTKDMVADKKDLSRCFNCGVFHGLWMLSCELDNM